MKKITDDQFKEYTVVALQAISAHLCTLVTEETPLPREEGINHHALQSFVNTRFQKIMGDVTPEMQQNYNDHMAEVAKALAAQAQSDIPFEKKPTLAVDNTDKK